MTIRYDQQTRDRAIRLWLEHVQDGASKSAADRAVGELLDIKPSTLKNWTRAYEKQQQPAPEEVSVKQLQQRIAGVGDKKTAG